MVFNSINFFVFLGVILIIYYLVPVKFRKWMLLPASIYFYAFLSIKFVILIFVVSAISFWGALLITNEENKVQKKKFLLYLIIALVFLPLIVYKYLPFFIENINYLIPGRYSALPVFHLLLPLGISYYTFQAVSYIIDVNLGKQKAERNFLEFFNYLIFFPKLLMGPIERSIKFLPQLKQARKFDESQFSAGLKLILFGLLKKLVIADRIAIYTCAVFENYEYHTGITLLVASLMYTIQMYTDFSGYTDIALGVAKLFGYELTDNFNRPFFATSMTEFWRRWHITLSTWLADYVYTPLAIKWRNAGTLGTVIAVNVTFVLIGVWHGAGWNFVIFGIINGLALGYEIVTKKFRKKIARNKYYVYNVFSIVFTFLYFSFALIIFNVSSLNSIFTILSKIATFKGPLTVFSITTFINVLPGISILFIYEFFMEYFNRDIFFHPYKYTFHRYLIYASMILTILLFGVLDGGQFIYFQF